jgi:hypothetical protein
MDKGETLQQTAAKTIRGADEQEDINNASQQSQ